MVFCWATEGVTKREMEGFTCVPSGPRKGTVRSRCHVVPSASMPSKWKTRLSGTERLEPARLVVKEPLAMMFGTPVVAPGYGAYEEYLGGTDNELYRPDDAASLAEAVRRISQKDRAVIAAANKRLAAQWGWDNILSRCLPELRKRQGETVG